MLNPIVSKYYDCTKSTNPLIGSEWVDAIALLNTQKARLGQLGLVGLSRRGPAALNQSVRVASWCGGGVCVVVIVGLRGVREVGQLS